MAGHSIEGKDYNTTAAAPAVATGRQAGTGYCLLIIYCIIHKQQMLQLELQLHKQKLPLTDISTTNHQES